VTIAPATRRSYHSRVTVSIVSYERAAFVGSTGAWSVTGSVAKYVAAIANPVADSSSAGGNPQTRQFIYRGDSINGPDTTTLVPTAQAIRTVFDWVFDNGGPTLPLNGAPTIPGVTPQIADGLTSPSAWEYGGVTRQFGARASLPADLLVRHSVDFYMRQTDTTTGRVQDTTCRAFDLALITNAPDGRLSRDYVGGTFTGTYRFGTTLEVGANYTRSRARGNFDGESVASGPVQRELPNTSGCTRAVSPGSDRRKASGRACGPRIHTPARSS
jgi:hypothetical protein